jgi:DNA adenine methylase
MVKSHSGSESNISDAVLPFIKWPGGKRQLASQIAALVPDRFGRYFEPFLGGGVLFFATRPEQAILSDKNAELIEAYSQVRDDLEAVIEKLRKLPNNEEGYYAVRSSSPTSPSGRAARMIYLIDPAHISDTYAA